MPDVAESPQDREKRLQREAAIREMLAGSGEPGPVSPAGEAVGRMFGATPTPPADTRPEWLRAYAEAPLAPIEAEQAAERERAQRGIDAARRARLAREAAYDRGLQQGINHDVAENADEPMAFLSGARSGLTFNLDDEINAMLSDQPYHQARAAYGAERRADQAAAPGWATAGELVGSLPYAALTPVGAASRVPGALGVAERMHAAGRAALPIAAASGFGRSEGSLVPTGDDQTIGDYLRGAGTVAADTVREGASGYVLGAGGQLIGEGVGRLAQGVASELRPGSAGTQRRFAGDLQEDDVIRDRINLLEEEAAARRLREASGGRALLTNLREMDDVPGGVRQVADELRDQGVVAPRGTMFQSPPDAISRARVAQREVGQRIGDVNARVQQAYEAGNVEALVDLEPLAQGYAQAAERFAEAGDRAGYARMMDLAEQTAERGSVPMSEARRALENIDRAVYGAEGGISVPQVARLNDELSQGLRRSLRESMDSAIERVYPTEGAALPQGVPGPREAVPTHLADRRRYQALRAFTDGTDDIPLRDAGRRVVSLTDTGAGLAGSVSGGPVTGAAMWIANRVLRANEHGVAAMLAEREVAQLQRELAQRLSEPVAARVMEQLRPAIARGRHMTALAMMQLLRNEPEIEAALDDSAPEDDADDARARELLGPGTEGDINEDEDEARARDLL